jgi:hypothetical protein
MLVAFDYKVEVSLLKKTSDLSNQVNTRGGIQYMIGYVVPVFDRNMIYYEIKDQLIVFGLIRFCELNDHHVIKTHGIMIQISKIK